MPDPPRTGHPARSGARPPPAGAPVAQVPLAGGGTLVVRPMVPADAAALQRLFAALPAADVHLRFFSGHPPPPGFVAGMAAVGTRGGVGLVAVAQPGPGGAGTPSDELVAEASAEPLPDGGAELGITVLPGRRGWLGPYLLDLLATLAARRGLADLQAEVLLENRRMLALLRARGCAVLRRDTTPAVVRVVVATAGGMPAWPGHHDRVRVLAEAPGGHWRAEEAARAAGFAVVTCPGDRPGFPTCPAHWSGTGAPCPLVAGADLVVVAGDDRPGRLVDHHRRWHPTAAVRLDASPPTPGEAPAPAVPTLPPSTSEVVPALQDAAAGRGRAPAEGDADRPPVPPPTGDRATGWRRRQKVAP